MEGIGAVGRGRMEGGMLEQLERGALPGSGTERRREGGREGQKEGGREGGTEGGREGGRGGGKVVVEV